MPSPSLTGHPSRPAPCCTYSRPQAIDALAGPSVGASALLEPEQITLAIEAAAVPDEAARRADDTVARNDDGDRVATVGEADGPGRARLPDLGSELSVRDGLAVGDIGQCRPDTSLKRCAMQPDGKVEVGQPTGEIGPELARRLREQWH